MSGTLGNICLVWDTHDRPGRVWAVRVWCSPCRIEKNGGAYRKTGERLNGRAVSVG